MRVLSPLEGVDPTLKYPLFDRRLPLSDREDKRRLPEIASGEMHRHSSVRDACPRNGASRLNATLQNFPSPPLVGEGGDPLGSRVRGIKTFFCRRSWLPTALLEC